MPGFESPKRTHSYCPICGGVKTFRFKESALEANKVLFICDSCDYTTAYHLPPDFETAAVQFHKDPRYKCPT